MASFVRTQQIEHEIGASGRFALRVTNPDVELRAVDGTVARVRIEFGVRASSDSEADGIIERVGFRVRQGEGFLEVSEPRDDGSGLGSIARALGFGGSRVDARIVAEVPAGADVTYTGVSADLTSIGFTGAQEYRTVSGDLVVTDGGGRLRVNGVSSDISLRAERPVWLQANTVSGDLFVIAPLVEECRIVTVSGDVEIETALASGPQHRVETVSGDLSLGLVGGMTMEVRGLSTDVDVAVAHRSEGSRDRRRYVIGDGAAQLLFSSMSGDASVRTSRHAAPGFPAPPTPPAPPPLPSAPATPLDEDEELRVLRSLERGEIDVEEASRRLAGGGSDA